MRTAVILAIGGLVWVGQQQPQRDSSNQVVQPAGSISGVVLDAAAEPAPLHRVVLTLRGPSLGAGRLAVTDVDGRFSFPGLSAGNFTIEAERAGYVRTFYGSNLLGKGPGLAVAVGEGETVGDLKIQMIRGGVVSGAVRDAYGRPQANAEVSLVPLATRTGLPEAGRLVTIRTTSTGSYRAHGLTPGRYVVAVQPGFNYNGAAQYSREQLDALMSMTARASQGDLPEAANAPAGYAPTFFPGASDVRSAAAVTVEPGQETGGIDVALQFVRTTRLEGRVIAPSGLDVKDVQLRIESSGLALAGLELRSYMGTGPAAGMNIPVRDGAFQRVGLTPGRYSLIARASATQAAGTVTLWGVADVEVSGQSVLPLSLELHRTMTIAGTMDIGPGSSSMRPDLPVVLRSAEGNATLTRRTTARSDGSFSFPDVAPGRYWIDPDSVARSDWRTIRVTRDGTDLVDGPLTVSAGQNVSGLRVSASDLPALKGRLVDSADRPATGYVIVVYAIDKNQWTNDRRIHIARPATNGQYSVPPLPKGEYFVSAAPDVDPADLSDPAFFEMASPSALKVVVDPGRAQNLDLRIPGRF